MRKLHSLIGLGMVACMSWNVACASVLITELTHKATTGGKKPVTFLSEVRNGQDFELAVGARAVAVDLKSGREYEASGPGTFRVEEDGVRAVSGSSLKTRALPARNLPEVKVVVARVSQAASILRKLPKLLTLQSSANTAVLTPTPTLSWDVFGGDSTFTYKVRLSDSAGNVLINEQTQEKSLTVPASAGLTSGRNYLWTVEAVNQNGSLPGLFAVAQLSVVPPDTVQLLKSIAPQPGASFSDHVLYAAQLQEAGADEDARAVWKSLLAGERRDDPILNKLAHCPLSIWKLCMPDTTAAPTGATPASH